VLALSACAAMMWARFRPSEQQINPTSSNHAMITTTQRLDGLRPCNQTAALRAIRVAIAITDKKAIYLRGTCEPAAFLTPGSENCFPPMAFWKSSLRR
jgi:hypothetical protein